MQKRVKLVIAVLLIVGLGAMAWLICYLEKPVTPDPVYRGKRLSEWLNDLNSPTPGLPASATEAIRQMGTNAIPRLLREASVHNSFPKEILIDLLKRQSLLKFHFESSSDHQSKALRGFCALRETGALAVAQGLTNSDKWIRLGCVGQWDMCTYYPAMVFEPLLNSLRDPEPMVRARAANALGMLHQQPERAVPALTELLRDKNDWVRCMAAAGLDLYGDPAKPAVPVLLRCLTNCSSEFRSFGTHAVKKLDPQAAARAGIK